MKTLKDEYSDQSIQNWNHFNQYIKLRKVYYHEYYGDSGQKCCIHQVIGDYQNIALYHKDAKRELTSNRHYKYLC